MLAIRLPKIYIVDTCRRVNEKMKVFRFRHIRFTTENIRNEMKNVSLYVPKVGFAENFRLFYYCNAVLSEFTRRAMTWKLRDVWNSDSEKVKGMHFKLLGRILEWWVQNQQKGYRLIGTYVFQRKQK